MVPCANTYGWLKNWRLVTKFTISVSQDVYYKMYVPLSEEKVAKHNCSFFCYVLCRHICNFKYFRIPLIRNANGNGTHSEIIGSSSNLVLKWLEWLIKRLIKRCLHLFLKLTKMTEGLFEGFRSEKWFELQIFWNVNIHIFDQSCTWEDLANFKKCQRLFQLLWGQGTHYFHPNALESSFL